MELHSASFDNGGKIAGKYGKKSENISPQLSWSDLPSGTRSLAIAMVDLNPVARGYVHWVVAGVAPSVTSLDEGAAVTGMPAGSRELEPYAGPFPPSGTHEYEFTLYALDTEPSLPAKATLAQFLEAAESNILATARLTGTFTKGKA
jgi:Raf kinase inhibitor-like YbhB/YbcL family protein